MSLVLTVKGGLFSGVAAVEQLIASSSTPLSAIRDFLLLQHPSALGTAIHATPLVPALRQAVPGCRIAVVASGFSLDVFRGNPGVDFLIETPSPMKDLKGAVRALRAQHPFRGGDYAALTSTGPPGSQLADCSVAATAIAFVPMLRFSWMNPIY